MNKLTKALYGTDKQVQILDRVLLTLASLAAIIIVKGLLGLEAGL